MKNTLNEILIFCGKKRIHFVLTKEEKKENYINYNISDNELIINISDTEDENFEKVLENKLNQLKQLLN